MKRIRFLVTLGLCGWITAGFGADNQDDGPVNSRAVPNPSIVWLKPGKKVFGKLSAHAERDLYPYAHGISGYTTLSGSFRCSAAPKTVFDTFGYVLTWYDSAGIVLDKFEISTTQCRKLNYNFTLQAPKVGQYALSVAPPPPNSRLLATQSKYVLQIGAKPPSSAYIYPPGTINAQCVVPAFEYMQDNLNLKKPVTYQNISMSVGDFGQKLIPILTLEWFVPNRMGCAQTPPGGPLPEDTFMCKAKPRYVYEWYCFVDMSKCQVNTNPGPCSAKIP